MAILVLCLLGTLDNHISAFLFNSSYLSSDIESNEDIIQNFTIYYILFLIIQILSQNIRLQKN